MRVAAKLGARHRYELEDRETYRRYATSIHRWAAQQPQLQNEVSHLLSYTVSPVRSIELLLFV